MSRDHVAKFRTLFFTTPTSQTPFSGLLRARPNLVCVIQHQIGQHKFHIVSPHQTKHMLTHQFPSFTFTNVKKVSHNVYYCGGAKDIKQIICLAPVLQIKKVDYPIKIIIL